MNITHIYDGHEKVYGGRGSVRDVVWNIARHTAKQGHDVRVIERQWRGLDRHAEHEGVTFERLSLSTGADEPWERVPHKEMSTPLSAGRLVVDRTNFALSALRNVRRSEYDVLHVHLPFAANALVTIAPWLRDRTVYTAHIGEIEKRIVDPRFSPDVYLAKRVARTFALNPAMRDAFASRGVTDEQLEVIPNGVNVDRFDDTNPADERAVREQYGLDDDQIVLFVGTLTPRKGVAELIQAVGRLEESDALEDTQFVIAGNRDIEPEYAQRVREIATEEGVGDSVTFTGFVSNEVVETLYELATLFVLPSFEEGSSIVVTEAIASGTAIVSTRIDGTTQQIEDGTHGYLVEPGNVKELSERIEYIITTPSEQARMNDNVEKRALELSWDEITRNIVNVYRDISERSR